MAFAFYLNMEKLALEIIEEHLTQMSNCNYCEDSPDTIDNVAFKKNLKYGFIIVVMLSVFVESAVNSVLSDIIHYKNERLIKCSVEEKFDIIYLLYNKDIKPLRADNNFAKYKEMNRIRNELIHFKFNYIGHSSCIPNIIVGNISLAKFFVKSKMCEYISCVNKFIEFLGEDLKLNINMKCDVFGCDGAENYYKFIQEL
jgi:hypothetical protein